MSRPLVSGTNTVTTRVDLALAGVRLDAPVQRSKGPARATTASWW